MKVTSKQLLDLFGLKVGDVVRVYDNSYNLNEILDMELVVRDARLQLKNIDKIYGAQYFELTWLLDFKYEIIKPTPKLTEDEKVILRNLFEDGYKYVYRYEEGILKFSSEKPYKKKRDNEIVWAVSGIQIIPAFKKLFTFITWEDEEPYNIEELLKGTL